jgi:formylglycine-generating enzyme required for sulfatase activity
MGFLAPCASAQYSGDRGPNVSGGGKRIALVIGNDAYQKVDTLKNARNDARLMAATLTKAGFEVTQVNDQGRDGMWRNIDIFKSRINKGDEVVFYFAGHGLQINSNQLLLPVDISAVSDGQVQRDAVSLVEVQDALKDARFALLVIDACRDNPFPKTGTRSIGGGTRGLLPPEPVTGQVIVLSAGRNQKALDSVPGEPVANGLFTWELTQAIQAPGMEIRAALERVKDRVDDKAKSVGHDQRPGMVSDLRGNFYFFGAPSVQVPVAVAVPDPEIAFWNEVRTNGSREYLEAYFKEYPKGKFLALAALELKKLDDRDKAERARQTAPRVPAEVAAVRPPREPVEAEQALVRVAPPKPEETKAPKPGAVFKDCAECAEMVVIPAGSFDMGDNGSTHRVALKAFAMGKTEVTQAQWQAVMGGNPSLLRFCGSDCPVENISWDDAQAFVQKLSAKTGKSYRLPSEAEWEYACRAGARQEYCGSDSLGAVAWYGAFATPAGSSDKSSQRVGTKPANAFGLHDMTGNVWELIQDCWNPTFAGAPVDGSAWNTGACGQRLLRGGSWNLDASYARAAYRGRLSTWNRNNNSGLRLARTLP